MGQFASNFLIEGDDRSNHFCSVRYANECLTTIIVSVVLIVCIADSV